MEQRSITQDIAEEDVTDNEVIDGEQEVTAKIESTLKAIDTEDTLLNADLKLAQEDHMVDEPTIQILQNERKGCLTQAIRSLSNAVPEKMKPWLEEQLVRFPNIEKVYKEAAEEKREEELRRQFIEAGLDPEKSLDVVHYLESHVKQYHQKSRKSDDQVEGFFHYTPDFLSVIRKCTEDIEDPIALMDQLAQIIDFDWYGMLDTFSAYFETLKQEKQLPDLLRRLQTIGPMKRTEARHIKVNTVDEEKHVVFEIYDAPKSADPLHEILKKPREERDALLSAENLGKVRELNELFIEHFQREGEPFPVLNVVALSDLLHIVQDETRLAMYKQFIASGARLSAYDTTDIYRSTRRFFELVEKVPEIKELFAIGFDVSGGLSYSMFGSSSKRIENVLNTEELSWQYRQILDNKTLCANGSLMHKYGFPAYPYKESGRESFYREADTELLEKTLLVWDMMGDAFSIRNKDENTYSQQLDLSEFWKDNALSLQKFSLEELKTALAKFKDAKQHCRLPLTVHHLVLDCETAEDLAKKLELIAEPGYQRAVFNEEFMSIIGQTKGQVSAIDASFKEEENFFRLYDQREALIRNMRIIKEGNNQRATDLSFRSYEILAQLGEQQVKTFAEIFNTFGVFTIDEQKLSTAFAIARLSPEQRQSIAEMLNQHSLPALFPVDSYATKWSEQALEIFLEGDKKVAELLQLGTSLSKATDIEEWLMWYKASKNLQFLDYLSLHPDEMARVVSFLQDKGSPQAVGRLRVLQNEMSGESAVRISELITSEGLPTPTLIHILAEKENVDHLLYVVNNQSIELFPTEEQEFWKFFHKYGNDETGKLILDHRKDIYLYEENNHCTIRFIHDLVKVGEREMAQQLLSESEGLLETLEGEEKEFWQYWRDVYAEDHQAFILKHKFEFSSLVQEGKETERYWELFMQEYAQTFVDTALREDWKMALGDEGYKNFTDALPKSTDEKRNAFTHNKYDRTSDFLRYCGYAFKEDFSFTRKNIPTLTSYIEAFGFSRTPILYHYFKNLYEYENGTIKELPDDIKETGLRSTGEIVEQLNNIKKVAYSKEPITNLSNFTPFELQMLNLITGKSTHSHGGNNTSFEQMVEYFQEAYANERIASLPPEYEADEIVMNDVEIEFDASGIKGEYSMLREEILNSIETPESIDSLKAQIQGMFAEKLKANEIALQAAEEKKRVFMEKERGKLENYAQKLNDVTSADALMKYMWDLNFEKSYKSTYRSVMRGIVFRKVFEKNYSPMLLENIRMQIEGEIKPQGILTVVNVIDHMAKAHVLNFEKNNQEGYWGSDMFTQLAGTEKGKSLIQSFDPYRENLHKAVADFEVKQLTTSKRINIIPDRGFIGEMSGYLANVCYTKEYPLLEPRPNLVPYKFVMDGATPSEKEFLGSVLVFEVDDAEGNPCLLIRGFDVPKESDIEISKFIETFIDKMAVIGQQRGKKRVLIPGLTGAISNYQMTINHMVTNYKEGKPPVSLKEEFTFNGYNLTNECYVAREINQSEENE